MDEPNSQRPVQVVIDPQTVKAIRQAFRPSFLRRAMGLLWYIIPLFLFMGMIGAVFEKSVGATSDVVEDVVIDGEYGTDDKIVIINLAGEIAGEGSYAAGSDMVGELAVQMRQALDDRHVKAVILQVDSPGGGLTASDILHDELMRLKKAGKPVVVLVGDLAASGGYYIAAGADSIVAGPTSLVGSFGVILSFMQVKDLMQKIGVQVEPIKSTNMKDIGSPFREMSDEEKDFFQNLIAQYHERFVSIIAEGRGIDPEKVRSLANGKVYSAKEALDHGLIDKIGYFDDALAEAKTLSGLSNPKVVRYNRKPSLQDLLQASFQGAARSAVSAAVDSMQTSTAVRRELR